MQRLLHGQGLHPPALTPTRGPTSPPRPVTHLVLMAKPGVLTVACRVVTIRSTSVLLPGGFQPLWEGWERPVDSSDPERPAFLSAVPIFYQKAHQEQQNHSPEA